MEEIISSLYPTTAEINTLSGEATLSKLFCLLKRSTLKEKHLLPLSRPHFRRGLMCRQAITKTRLFEYMENFTSKNRTFSDKNSDIFHISTQNIDCVYSLEPPRRGGSNEYPQSIYLGRNKKNNIYPCKPQFYYIKVGFKGVKII